MLNVKSQISKLMGITLFALTLFVVFFAMQTSAAPGIIFGDGFVTGDFSNWDSVTGTWTISTGGYITPNRARVYGDTTDAELRKEISTVGKENISLSFWYDTTAGWDTNDSVEIQWTSNGTEWNLLDTLDIEDKTPLVEGGEEWVKKNYPLPEDTWNNTSFGFRFLANVTSASDSLSIDEVLLEGDAISGELTPEPTVTPTPGEPTPMPTVEPTPTEELTPTPTPEEPIPEPGKPAFWEWFREFMRSVFERQRQMFERIWG